MVTLISDKADFRAWNIISFQERHYIMIKESTHQEDITIFTMYALNNSFKIHKAKINKVRKLNKSINLVGMVTSF